MDKIKDIIINVESLKAHENYSEAIAILEQAIINYNSDYRLYEELADIYLFQGELDKGLKSVNFALSIHADSATGNYLKGFILLSKDKVKEAIKFLEASNGLLWNNSEVLRNLGWAYTMVGETDKGIMILKRALVIAPNDALITEDLAMALIGTWEISQGNQLLQQLWKNVVAS